MFVLVRMKRTTGAEAFKSSLCAVLGVEGMLLKAYGFSEEEPYAFSYVWVQWYLWRDTAHEFFHYKEVVQMACFVVPVAGSRGHNGDHQSCKIEGKRIGRPEG